jgi:hypothetical protein
LTNLFGAPPLHDVAMFFKFWQVRDPSVIVTKLPPPGVHLGETGPLSQGVQARRKALRIRPIHGMGVRKKRPRGFK